MRERERERERERACNMYVDELTYVYIVIRMHASRLI